MIGIPCIFYASKEKAEIAEGIIWKNIVLKNVQIRPSCKLCVDGKSEKEILNAELEGKSDFSSVQMYGVCKEKVKKEIRAIRWGAVYPFSDGTFFIYKPLDLSLMEGLDLKDIIAEKFIRFEGENGEPIEVKEDAPIDPKSEGSVKEDPEIIETIQEK